MHVVRLYRDEIIMIRWLCGFTLKEKKNSSILRELLGLKLVSLMIIRAD